MNTYRVTTMMNKWVIVSEVYENGSFCSDCEYYDKYGDCRLLTQDRMVAEYCLGWDTWMEHEETKGADDE